MKWFTDLLSPVQSTKEDLDAAVSAGERFGNGMAKAIEFILTPLTRLMDGIKWISENMPSWEGIKIVYLVHGKEQKHFEQRLAINKRNGRKCLGII